jgi:hypothetical protein
MMSSTKQASNQKTVGGKNGGITEYERTWRCRSFGDGSKSMSELADAMERAAKTLRAMEADGVTLYCEMTDDYGFMICQDKQVAKKYGFKKKES